MTARILVGTCFWADATLVESGAFYPPAASTSGPSRLQASPANPRGRYGGSFGSIVW